MKKLIGLCLLLCSLVAIPHPAMAKDAVIRSGVHIMGIDVGGMTKMEAMTAVEDYFDAISQKTFALTCSDGTVEQISLKDWGFQWDTARIINKATNFGNGGGLINRYKDRKNLEITNLYLEAPFKLNENKLRASLDALGETHDSPAVNAVFTRQGEGFVLGSEGSNGTVMDFEETMKEILDKVAEYMETGNASCLNLKVTTTTDYPKVTSKDLEYIKDNLGTFKTEYQDSSSNRKQNIKTAVGYLNGTILQPGESLSTSEAIHPREEEYGYATAAQYSNGDTEQSVGGGVCQVSTTLYNALLLAELQIDKRFCHSMVVHYVDYGADAAIADGTKDLVFTNNLSTPIYIEGIADGSWLTFNIWGIETRPANRTVKYFAETLSEEYPKSDEYNEKKSDEYPKGEVHFSGTKRPKVVATLTKYVYEDGKCVEKTLLHTDTYAMSKLNRITGTKEP